MLLQQLLHLQLFVIWRAKRTNLRHTALYQVAGRSHRHSQRSRERWKNRKLGQAALKRVVRPPDLLALPATWCLFSPQSQIPPPFDPILCQPIPYHTIPSDLI